MKKSSYSTLLFLAVGLAVCAGLFASSNPDGLEHVANVLDFEHRTASTPGVFVDYAVNAIIHPAFSTIIAGIFGILLILFVFHSIIHLKHIVALLIKWVKADNN